MKYFKQSNQYRASNLVLDMNTETAHSYKWYEIAKRFPNGEMVVNNYSYSPSTARQASKLYWFLKYTLGMNPIEIECPNGLQDLNSGIEYYERMINKLMAEIQNPRTNKAKNLERTFIIEKLNHKITKIRELMGTK
jgi:hypothetical protein